jgi:hypothetical protein
MSCQYCLISSAILFYIIIKNLKYFTHSYNIYLKFRFHRCVLRDEMNKTRYHLHIYFLKKLHHHCFKSSPSIWSSKIRVNLAHVISFLFPPYCHLSSGRRSHTVVLCHASFLCSKDELDAFASGNASSYHPFPSSQNRIIESTPSPPPILSGPSYFHPPLI